MANEKENFDWYAVNEGPNKLHRRIYTLMGKNTLIWSANLGTKPRPDSFKAGRWPFIMRRVKGDGAIRVPDGLYDLWQGQKDDTKRFNAPRVMQEIEGDFVARVKVTADWNPSLARYYHAAGLVVWGSENQYMRLERNSCINSRGQAFCFTTPMYDLNGKRVNAVKTAANAFFLGRSTWIRIERVGQKLTTAFGHDGQLWTDTGVLTTQLPHRVQVGIHVINNAAREFIVEFQDFKIDQF